MHCPKCGLQIESDEVSFCSRCGQTLDLVRAALGMDVPRETSIASRRSGVNLGVVLMFLGSLPAALGLLTDSIKLPGGFLALVVGYLAIVLGLGPIIKALRTDENSLSGIIDRALRKEIAFGSTLMFFGILFATCLISFVPGPWERVALITFLPATLGILLLSSGSIRKSVNGILGNESPKPISSISTSSTETLGPAETLEPLSLSMGTGAATADLEPPSVTENTTQLLRKRGAE